MGDMKLGDVKSIASLKKSGLTADLTISVSKSNTGILSLKCYLFTEFHFFAISKLNCSMHLKYIFICSFYLNCLAMYYASVFFSE